jgi:lipopolysaccharide biosynthesis regulator YciM
MQELLWLLLPVAAASGWGAARLSARRAQRREQSRGLSSADYVRGLNYLLNEQPDKALEVFLQMVDVDSETVDTHLILGSLFRRRGEVDRAIRVHQNLIARPNLEVAHKRQALLELGKDYMKAGLLDRAEGVFQDLRQSGGQALKVDELLRQIYEQEKEWDSAIAAAEQLDAHADGSRRGLIAHYLCEQASLALRAEEPSRAAQLAKRALATDGSCLRAHLLMAEIASARGDHREALRSHKRAISEDLSFLPVVLPLIARSHAQARDADGYLHYLEGLEAEHPGGSVSLALAAALAERGRMQEARVLLEREAARLPVAAPALQAYLEFEAAGASGQARAALSRAADSVREAVAAAAAFVCTQCGFEAKNLIWQCPSCHGWGTLRPHTSACGAGQRPPGTGDGR